MILRLILEGLGLGALPVLVCAVGISRGAVGMVGISAAISGIMMIFIR